MTTGDFNGDGKLDLALPNQADNTVSILLGNGDGTFQRHTDYATGATAQIVTTGDFNADGNLDLAVTTDGSNAVSILLGNGDGTFPTHVEYATDGTFHITIADLNGDGKLDLAVQGVSLNVLLGHGDGSFPTHVEYAVGSGPAGIAIGDFNGDGRLDLAEANFNDNTVSVLLQATTSPTPGQIQLRPRGQIRDGTEVVQLKWRGATSSLVDIFRNNMRLARVPNDGLYVDELTAPGQYTYKVCEARSMNCSNEVTVRGP